jgi:hypothetical protein
LLSRVRQQLPGHRGGPAIAVARDRQIADGAQHHLLILHVFEFRDGLISRENVWIDAGAAIAQLTSGPAAATSAG